MWLDLLAFRQTWTTVSVTTFLYLNVKNPIFTNNVGLIWFPFSKYFLEKLLIKNAVLGYFVSFYVFLIFQGFCCHYSLLNYLINDVSIDVKKSKNCYGKGQKVSDDVIYGWPQS